MNTYIKSIKHLNAIDIYRILDLYGVTRPPVQHAVKKLLCAGQRGVKSERQDLQEALESIDRALVMMDEDDAYAGMGSEEKCAVEPPDARKPDWKDAPEWASWLAQDSSGVWNWYTDEPEQNSSKKEWWPRKDGDFAYQGSGRPNPNWRNTLEARP